MRVDYCFICIPNATMTGPNLDTLHFKTILLQYRSPNVLEVAINRPAAKNAYNRAVYRELLRLFDFVRHEAQITVLVFTGVGDTFSAGADLYEINEYADKKAYKAGQLAIMKLLVSAFVHCPKLLVSLVHGSSIGVAFALNALCDIVYCTETAQFMAPYTQIGLCAEAATSYTLPTIMGRIKAAECLLFGKPLNANEALMCNFVACIFKHETLDAEFWPYIIKQASLPANLLEISKRLIRATESQFILSQLRVEINELQHLNISNYHLLQVEKFQERKNNKSKL